MSGITPTPQQSAAITLRDGPLLVSAAAGSGKTRVLVERLIHAVLDLPENQHINDFLVITYTRAAAGELRHRIGQSLSARRAVLGASPQVTGELLRLHRAQIGTIHSFCGMVIRRFAVQCGVRPNFRQLENSEQAALRGKALEDALELLYAGQPEGSPFDLLADTLSNTGKDAQLGEVILGLYEALQALPDPHRWMEDQLTALRAPETVPLEETVWGALLLKDAISELNFARSFLQLTCDDMDELFSEKYGPAFQDDAAQIDLLLQACAQGWAAASAAFSGKPAYTKLGSVRDAKEQATLYQGVRGKYKKIRDALSKVFAGEAAEHAADFAAMVPVAEGLFLGVRTFEEAYTALKFRRNALDFSDLEHFTHKLLCATDPQGALCPTADAHTLAADYTELLVDEYQDVNQVQEDIIQALAQAGLNLFLVGDVRQSIYGFRQADPAIFMAKYTTWPETVVEGEPRCVTLPNNFRSHPKLLEAVNDIFKRVMSMDTVSMDYGNRESLKPPPSPAMDEALDCNPPDAATVSSARAALWLCDNSQALEDEDVTLHQREAAMVASLLAQTLGQPIGDGKGGFRPAEAGDMVILLRTKKDIPFYRQALTLRGIPSVTQEDSLFYALEIQVVMACFQVLNNPRQDVPLLTLMRSPIYQWTPDDLAAMRACASGDLQDALLAAMEQDQPKAVQLWQDMMYLRSLSADTPVELVYHALLERLRLLEIFETLPGGAGRRHNLLSLIPIVAGCASVSECCTLLERMEQSGQTPTGLTETQTGVALMTIHKSKGLEFPVVVVASTAKKFNQTDSRKPILFHKGLGLGLKVSDLTTRVQYPTMARDAVARRLHYDTVSEEMRLLYVALTRAKDYLFVTASVRDWDKTLQNLSLGLTERPHPYQVMHVQNMVSWLLLALLRSDGLHSTDTWQIRQWQVCRPNIDAETTEEDAFTAKLYPLEPLSPTAPQTLVSAGPVSPFTPLEAGIPYGYNAAIDLPSKLTATELKSQLRDIEQSEGVGTYAQPRYSADFPRPRFMEETAKLSAAAQGTALHGVMQNVEFSRCTTLEGVTAEFTRLTVEQRLTPEQLAVVQKEQILAFIQSPLGQRVLASSDVRRELPFSLLTPYGDILPNAPHSDSVLLQGMIDLLFWETEGWVIVDFKTDRLGRRSPKAIAADYQVQLDTYASAITRMTGQPIHQRIIYFLQRQHEVPL